MKLRIEEKGKVSEKTFPAGIGTGTRSSLSYLVPEGVYTRFEAWAGLHSELGTGGNVLLEIKGNGKSLARVGPIAGSAPTAKVSLSLAGVTNLQLIATSAGGDGKGNDAVWGKPRLVK